MSGWGAAAISGDAATALATLQDALPVRLITTERAQFATCLRTESLSAVVERNRGRWFDFVPVRGRGPARTAPILGVVEIAEFQERPAPKTPVAERMQPLGAEWRIAADASIVSFLRDADARPFRLVVSGKRVRGLVTLSDVQRLPVRAALFAMVTLLEITMAELIRRRLPKSADWLTLLARKRAKAITRKLAKVDERTSFVDALLYTQFADKRTILRKAWPLPADPSLSRTRFEKDLRRIEKLRNAVAHANEYATTRRQAESVCDAVRQMLRWIEVLSAAMR